VTGRTPQADRHAERDQCGILWRHSDRADRGYRLAVRVVARSDMGIGSAQPWFGRTGVEARSQGYWLGVHQPLLPVDEFANRVEVSGVTGGLSDHMEQDIPKIVQAPLTPGERPPGQVGIGR
jgi:hypothetical protein